ncbi:MAG: LamG domain-containing protein [Candidatus Tectomicrobia bacterium]|nr:LamG domain-containing protein [Candidatus Tectomicrobia bacterium]
MRHTSKLFKTVLAVVLVCIAIVASVTTTHTSDGLVSWWRAEGDASDSADGSHGTLLNGVTFVPGKVGQAFSFDGVDDFVRIDSFTALDGLSRATFAFWVKMNAFPTDPRCNSGSCGMVLWGRNDPVLGIAIHSSLAIEVSRGNGSSWGSPSHNLSDGTLTGLNEWNHVAVVVDGTTDKIYINGVLDSAKTQDESSFANFGGLLLGAASAPSAPGTFIFLNGQLDEVTIYDRVLSECEIRDLAGNPCNQPPIADAGPDQVVECTSPDGAFVILNGSGSGNPDGEETLSFEWVEGDNPLASGQEVSVSLGVGEHVITLKVTDDQGAMDEDMVTITVEDTTPPVIASNHRNIMPPDAPITFTATTTDQCSATVQVQITGFDCFVVNPSGRRVDKTASCVVSIDGNTITILDSGGVGNHITWTATATDESGNTATAGYEIVVQNPGKGKK